MPGPSMYLLQGICTSSKFINFPLILGLFIARRRHFSWQWKGVPGVLGLGQLTKATQPCVALQTPSHAARVATISSVPRLHGPEIFEQTMSVLFQRM